jgi:multicomponent Na+:H+ antiporter subunit E
MWGTVWRYARTIVILTALWLILNERMSAVDIVTGAAIAAIAVLLTNRLVLRGSFRSAYPLRIRFALLFGLRLVVAIYVAGVQALRAMLSGTVRARVITVHTTLRSNFGIAMLANAITLTPGTVTIERDGETLRVLELVTGTAPGATVVTADKLTGNIEQTIRKVTE